jgi:hypothetical protein
MHETQAMGMNLNQLGNVFEVEKNKKLDHKALGFRSFKQLFKSLQFLGLVDIEHPSNNVVIMYLATKNGKSGFPFGDITLES